MSIYWERCDICGRHRPTRQCWLHPERNVCPYCCLACPERIHCPKPVWFSSIKRTLARRVSTPEAKSEAKKALEELLRKLEGS